MQVVEGGVLQINDLEFQHWRTTEVYLLRNIIPSWSLLGTSAKVRELMAVKQAIHFHDS